MAAALLLDEFIPYRLSYTANLVSELIADAYRAHFSISIPEWRILAHVAEQDGISQQEICRRTRMEKVTVSRAAIALIDRDLLSRTGNPSDGRSHLLRLSDAGRSLYDRIAPKALELERRALGQFSDAELRTLVSMLRRIDRAVLDEFTPRERPSRKSSGDSGSRN